MTPTLLPVGAVTPHSFVRAGTLTARGAETKVYALNATWENPMIDADKFLQVLEERRAILLRMRFLLDQIDAELKAIKELLPRAK